MSYNVDSRFLRFSLHSKNLISEVRTDKRTDGWTVAKSVRTDILMNERKHARDDGRTHRRAFALTHVRLDTRTDKRVKGQADDQLEEPTA